MAIAGELLQGHKIAQALLSVFLDYSIDRITWMHRPRFWSFAKFYWPPWRQVANSRK